MMSYKDYFKESLFISTLFVLIAFFGYGFTKPVNAAVVTGFNAGNIIDDSVFTRKNSMSAAQIQSFLNSKVPNCDTNGTKASEYGGGTRAQYGASKGYPKPYTCLRNFTQGGKTAARIIYDASQEFNINPQVLIVLLQKEQGLVTDTWPWSIQYRSATGYGCPDTAACDSNYYGFTNQVRWSARMFRAIMNQSPTWYTPYELGNNRIYWHPDTARCGSSTVNIQNLATVALYSYTPYRPNQSALNAGYGTGNSCGSYGNRNFYQYFKDWFGLADQKCTSTSKMGQTIYRLFSTKLARHYYTAFLCEANYLNNNTSYTLEGKAFSQSPSDADRRIGVFRLIKSGRRFWTASENERDNLVRNHRWKLEGTAFTALDTLSTSPKKPLYRLYNSKTKHHLWTSSESERDTISSGNSSWRYEGVAYHIFDDGQ